MKKETVKVGNFSAHLWQASDGRWKWHAHRAGKRILCAAKTLDCATTKAKAQLKALREGKTAYDEATPDVIAEFVAWRAARRESPPLHELLEQYLSRQRNAGLTAYYVDALTADLTAFANAHKAQRIADITPEAIADYLGKLPVGPRRYNNIRGEIVSFFRFAKNHGHLPEGLTAPERTQKQREQRKPVTIYTPQEFAGLLAAAPERWKLPLAIGGLAGIRTEEIAGLRWEHLKPDKALIEVPAALAKTRRRRLVPMCDALVEWIKASKPTASGMVAPDDRMDNQCIRPIRRAGAKWIKNALRHSYGSYRCAITKDVPAVSYEMGNSPAMVMSHYHEAQELSDALAWFATSPSLIKKNQKVTTFAKGKKRAA
jgi:integrase